MCDVEFSEREVRGRGEIVRFLREGLDANVAERIGLDFGGNVGLETESYRWTEMEVRMKELEVASEVDSERYGMFQSHLLDLQQELSRNRVSIVDLKDRMKRMEVGASDLHNKMFELNADAEVAISRLMEFESRERNDGLVDEEYVTRKFLLHMLHSGACGCKRGIASLEADLGRVREENKRLLILMENMAASNIFLIEDKLKLVAHFMDFAWQKIVRWMPATSTLYASASRTRSWYRGMTTMLAATVGLKRW